MKRLVPIIALFFFGAVLVFADETTEVYKRLFLEAQGLRQKYTAALNLVQLQDPSVAPALSDALTELISTQKSYEQASDKELYAQTVRIVAQALGDYKYIDAAPSLWDAVQQVPDPLVKAEALMALGKMHALDYAERISLLLRDLNFKPTQDPDYGEKVAYGAIFSLEKLRDIRGFSPVFFASVGWYSQRVRQEAAQALPNIVDDPTDPIMPIIQNEPSDRKVLALKAEVDSNAPNDRKIQAAVYALAIGQKMVPVDPTDARYLANLRKLALNTLIVLKAQGDAPVAGCVSSYQSGYDDEERLLALAALGANGADSAAAALRDIILKLDSDQQAGVSDETRNRMAKAAIENAALTKNKLLKPALISVAADDNWSGGILFAAQQALKAMP
ncbi:MAG: HEAT repeat domain-containing protein [Rectinemataceae bacterium]